MIHEKDFREISARALKSEGIKRFEKHYGKIKFLHHEETNKNENTSLRELIERCEKMLERSKTNE